MKTLISEKIKGLTKLLESDVPIITPGLSDQDQRMLVKKGKDLLQTVKDNLDKNQEPFDGMPMEDKIKLMAFTVYKRQNPESGNITNDEDASKILKSTIYRKNEKKLDEDLSKQLVKGFGLKIK